MEIFTVGVDFPPTRQTRQLARRQITADLEDVARYVDKIEVYLVEFSAEHSPNGTMCSAVIFLHGYTPMLVEECGTSLDSAIFRCATRISQSVTERLRKRRPGPAGMSILD